MLVMCLYGKEVHVNSTNSWCTFMLSKMTWGLEMILSHAACMSSVFTSELFLSLCEKQKTCHLVLKTQTLGTPFPTFTTKVGKYYHVCHYFILCLMTVLGNTKLPQFYNNRLTLAITVFWQNIWFPHLTTIKGNVNIPYCILSILNILN